jgi:hypothetical protein
VQTGSASLGSTAGASQSISSDDGTLSSFSSASGSGTAQPATASQTDGYSQSSDNSTQDATKPSQYKNVLYFTNW